ncbi:MAG: ABC transporter ATP-binding protein [Armatimonadota bacterium]|nr:ABC transporter ATP-binding protein [Armatimonadota bacterium]MDR5696226.1 ABC transporter ATP-binding protein [Armatimonadota bacterium]
MKRFPGVLALDRVDLEVRAGEVHAVLGQNGAGKTTLMNVLFGLVEPDGGEIYLRGRRVHFRSAHDALDAGIGMVHQTRRLVTAHNVLENIVLGHPRARGLLDLRSVRREVEALCARYRLRVDLDAKIWQLSEGEKQWVEILKALYRQAAILILDEPTATLTPPEVETLLAALDVLVREHGVTVLLVTHKLPIVMRAADSITVLRAGRVVARLRTADATEHDLVVHMIGHDVPARDAHPQAPGDRVLLSVEDLSAYGDRGTLAIRGMSFDLREGEILGVAGVTGNGQDELAQVLAGLRPVASGKVVFAGRDITGLGPLDRWRIGMGYVPAERSTVGSVGAFSLVENTALNYHFDGRVCRRGLLDPTVLEQLTARIMSTFDIRAPHTKVRAQHLSGGNLQKLILGRVLSREPRCIVAHLPTQGLDVEAAAFVRAKLLEARARGAAVLLISEDLDEILSVADRVAPMYEGRFVAVLPRDQVTPQTVGAMMAGLQPAEAV